MRRLHIVLCASLALLLSPFAAPNAEEASSNETAAADAKCSTPTIHSTSGLVYGLEVAVTGNPSNVTESISAF
ncbi:MAG: hypothetical protein KAI25_14280, partial [Hyphomicrobiaceae bacterium]|nr:hypothetical protein [Hyphomicrobiaceae bacterium]